MSFLSKLAGSLQTAVLGSPLKNQGLLVPSSPLDTRVAMLEDCGKLAHLGRELDGKIVAVFEQSAEGEVNRLVETLIKCELLAKIEDHKMGPAWRSRLMDLLSSERLSELSEENRVRLLVALAALNSWSTANVIAAKNLILSLPHEQIIKLKELWDSLDTTDTAQVVESLGQEYRWRVSSFINLQSLIYADERKAELAPFKFFSDIDDTLYASLKDYSFPNRKSYPGVLAFYAALQAGPNGNAANDVRILSNLVFLTARPQWMEAFTQSRLAKRGVKGGSVLSGSLRTIFSSESMALKKWSNFTAFEALYPECRFMFVGDSGQGDIILGQNLLKDTEEPVEGERKSIPSSPASRMAKSRVELVLIHDIQTKSQEPNTPIAKRIDLLKENIFLFDSYLMAAVLGYCQRLLSLESLKFVAEETLAELNATEFAANDRYDAKRKRMAEYAFAKFYVDQLVARGGDGERKLAPLSPDDLQKIGQVTHCNFYSL